ncbi:MAG: purine-cytosine permease family protein [Lachnospiraceae bacterium]
MERDFRVEAVPEIDRPASEKRLSGVGNFLGLYGGEHIAATEFIFGATLVSWGCSARDILLGLIIGNILAVLSYTFCCATIATDTRLTLYSYLKKILGPYAQRFYNLVWGICSIALAASGMCISATAIREVVGVSIQRQWYPTSIGFVAIVLVLGTIVTIVAANGFEAVAKFSSTCVPWMIIYFLVGAIVALPQLAGLTGVEISSLGDIWNIFNSNIGSGSGIQGAEKMSILHVICFAWLCNLSFHMGLNDMGLFRFAKNCKYGFVSAIGMFVGHFFAWVMVAVIGATASALLGVSLGLLDPGAVTNAVTGIIGLMAVIIAGWTTANPTIYRAALSLNNLFPKFSQKQVTYIIGLLMTIWACFPGMTNIGDIVQILGWSVVGVGAICTTEHYIFPRIGYARYWSMFSQKKINWAAVITWIGSVIFAFSILASGLIHKNFIFIFEYILAVVGYIILAGLMGARKDYRKEEEQEEKFQAGLKEFVNQQAEPESSEEQGFSTGKTKVANILAIVSYVLLGVIVIISIFTFTGALSIQAFKLSTVIVTVIYFILNGTATYIKFKNSASVLE